MNRFHEIGRRVWTLIHRDQFELQDLRFGARVLAKNPGFTLLVAGLKDPASCERKRGLHQVQI